MCSGQHGYDIFVTALKYVTHLTFLGIECPAYDSAARLEVSHFVSHLLQVGSSLDLHLCFFGSSTESFFVLIVDYKLVSLVVDSGKSLAGRCNLALDDSHFGLRGRFGQTGDLECAILHTQSYGETLAYLACKCRLGNILLQLSLGEPAILLILLALFGCDTLQLNRVG